MKINSSISYIATIACLLLFGSCKKDWLEAKPSKSLLVPTAIADFQAVLDNTALFNTGHPSLGMVSSDNYFLDYATWQSGSTVQERNCYIWEKDIYEGETQNYDWNPSFKQILYTNIVLEGLNKLTPGNATEQQAYDQVKGSALFYRSLCFFNLAQLFCLPYGTQYMKTPGLPLRDGANVNQHYDRSSVEGTYAFIMRDLLQAVSLLPDRAAYKTRPSKIAAFSLLARTSLVMQDYNNARRYADSALGLHNTLLDFNMLNEATAFPFLVLNDEVSYHYTLSTYSVMSRQAFNVDTTLFATYAADDLRKELFFTVNNSLVKFRGSFSGSQTFFGGLTTAEMYLVRAESSARLGNTHDAMDDLNTLLHSRWKTGTFTAFTAANAAQAVDIILEERRKELLFRGLRWPDLRRLNLEPARAVTLKRVLNGQVYELLPNDLKYALPIAADEIRLGGLQQNER